MFFETSVIDNQDFPRYQVVWNPPRGKQRKEIGYLRDS